MYTSVSTDFKDECKQNVNEYKRIAKIHVVEDNIDITNDDVLVDCTIEEIAYSNGTFVGNSVAKKINLNIINDGSYNLENKEIQVYVGIDYEGDGSDIELVPYGNFIIAKPENEEVKDSSNYVGYDYMMKAEKPYVEGNITYPISLYNYLSSVCTSLSITLGNSSIPNGSYSVLGDAYTNGESYRQVIEDIAKCCGGFAVIGRDNKLYIRTLDIASLNNITTEGEILIETEEELELVSETPTMANAGDNYDSESLTPNEYFDDFSTANKYGPVNKVALALNENVIGEDTIMQDNDSIAQHGIIEIRIADIAFLNSEAQRELCIQGVYNVLHNLNYTPFSVNYYGYPYIDSGDFIRVRSMKSGREYFSYVLNHTFTYNGGYSGKIEAPALTDVEDEYKATTDAKNAYRHTELRVNKIDGEITSIVEEIGDRSGKTTTITQDIDGIDSLVKETVDITNEDEGTDPLTMENAMKGSLLELHIYGNNSVFDSLYPADDLYPSDDLYPMGDSRIRIWTDNLCPDSIDRWINGFTGSAGQEAHTSPYNQAMIISEYIEVNDDYYLSLESSDYKVWNICYYDENKDFINAEVINNNESAQTLPSGAKYMRFVIVRDDFHHGEQNYENNYPEILPADIVDIKPMIMYGDEKGEYRGYNNTIVELGVTEVLRRLVKPDGTVIRDSFDLVNNNATITRIVGVDSGGNLYDMVTPVVTDLGEMILPIAEGKNYFEIVNYNAVCKVRWVIRNVLTRTFASTVELESEITQLANSINLQVSKKVGNNEIIARINMAVLGVDDAEVPDDIEKSVIEISANKVSISSDYFDLSKTGYITATGGTVGGITLSSNMLYKRYTQDGANYESGLNLPSNVGSTGNYTFLYAGRPVGENIVKSNMFIQHNGKVYFRTGSMSMIYEPTINPDGSSSWNNAMNFSADAINRYLPNGNRWTFDGITYLNSVPYGHRLSIYDAQIYTIHDGVHDLVMAGFKRVGNNLEASRVDFYGNSYVDGALIQTASSDERMKENIEESQTNALEIIDDIDFYSFDWKDKNKGHVDIGFIAQRLQRQYKKLVIYSEGTDNKGNPSDTYQIDLLNTLALTMKGVQELSKKVNELEEEINKLKGEK